MKIPGMKMNKGLHAPKMHAPKMPHMGSPHHPRMSASSAIHTGKVPHHESGGMPKMGKGKMKMGAKMLAHHGLDGKPTLAVEHSTHWQMADHGSNPNKGAPAVKATGHLRQGGTASVASGPKRAVSSQGTVGHARNMFQSGETHGNPHLNASGANSVKIPHGLTHGAAGMATGAPMPMPHGMAGCSPHAHGMSNCAPGSNRPHGLTHGAAGRIDDGDSDDDMAKDEDPDYDADDR